MDSVFAWIGLLAIIVMALMFGSYGLSLFKAIVVVAVGLGIMLTVALVVTENS